MNAQMSSQSSELNIEDSCDYDNTNSVSAPTASEVTKRVSRIEQNIPEATSYNCLFDASKEIVPIVAKKSATNLRYSQKLTNRAHTSQQNMPEGSKSISGIN